MSISICFIAEARIAGNWKKVGEDDLDGILYSEVSSPLRDFFTGDEETIVTNCRRGLPKDISDVVRKLIEEHQGWYQSWVGLDEILAFNWDNSAEVKNIARGLLDKIEKLRKLGLHPENTRIIYWVC